VFTRASEEEDRRVSGIISLRVPPERPLCQANPSPPARKALALFLSSMEEARAERRKEQLLMSAPGLWALVLTSALTIPIVFGG
jgi:hypothetical protein